METLMLADYEILLPMIRDQNDNKDLNSAPHITYVRGSVSKFEERR